ncbi:MAG: GcrA family cell cycle regulator [Minwuia sp.]|nr:GcrA family cell cycle regulator [Minwuia sp.]
MPGPSIWTNAMRARLRVLHREGRPVQETAGILTREFGIGVSTGMVCGQRGRLGLSVQKGGQGAPAGREAWRKAQRKSHAMAQQMRDEIEQARAEAAAMRAAVAACPTDLVLVRRAEDDTTCRKAPDRATVPECDGTAHWPGLHEPPRGRCAWPIGEVGEVGFGFCGAGPVVSRRRGLCAIHDAASRPRVKNDDDPETAA